MHSGTSVLANRENKIGIVSECTFSATNQQRWLGKSQELTHNEDFAHVVASQEELERSVVVKEIFDVPIVEHTLQPELRTALKTQVIKPIDVIAVVRSVRTCVLGVEEGKEI